MAEVSLSKYFPFIWRYSKIEEILNDKDLASLGDAYINFIYSLALSKNYSRPVGRKLNSSVLSIAIQKSGLRKLLPHRVSRHRQADAAEALIVYGWLSGAISIRESIDIVAREDDLTDNLTLLIKTILERSKIS